MPGDDVCLGAGYKQAFLVKVCAVDKDLVIHTMGICCCWHGDKPQQCEPPGQSAPCYPETCGEMVCGFAGKNPVDKDFKVPNLAGVRASINREGDAPMLCQADLRSSS